MTELSPVDRARAVLNLGYYAGIPGAVKQSFRAEAAWPLAHEVIRFTAEVAELQRRLEASEAAFIEQARVHVARVMELRDSNKALREALKEEVETMTSEDETTLWMAATRYYLGRRTYAVGSFCRLLRAAWPTLRDEVRGLIQRDVEREFEREGDKHGSLGDECDVAEWREVRRLWEGGER